jgi:hypothetical protein
MGAGLAFSNFYSETAYVAISWFNFEGPFPNGQWFKLGWWAIPPGGVPVVVKGQDLRTGVNEFFSWFASVGFGGPCWSGDLDLDVSAGVFNQAYNDDSNGCTVPAPFIGNAELEPDWYGLTIMLLAPGVAGQPSQGCAWALPTYTDLPLPGPGGGGIPGSGDNDTPEYDNPG